MTDLLKENLKLRNQITELTNKIIRINKNKKNVEKLLEDFKMKYYELKRKQN